MKLNKLYKLLFIFISLNLNFIFNIYSLRNPFAFNSKLNKQDIKQNMLCIGIGILNNSEYFALIKLDNSIHKILIGQSINNHKVINISDNTVTLCTDSSCTKKIKLKKTPQLNS